MTKKLIIFDFDGVLINTTDLVLGIMRSSNPHLSDDYFKKMSSGNFFHGLDHAIKNDGYVSRPDWEEIYKNGLKNLTTHDIIRTLVLELFESYMLAIVSSSNSSYIRDSLREEGIDHCFRDVLGYDSHARKTVKISNLLKKYELAPNNVLFITDTLGDVREANECGVASIGVTWGLHNKEDFEAGNPFAIVDTVPELDAKIAEFFGMQE